jgi:hypothetical protein
MCPYLRYVFYLYKISFPHKGNINNAEFYADSNHYGHATLNLSTIPAICKLHPETEESENRLTAARDNISFSEAENTPKHC